MIDKEQKIDALIALADSLPEDEKQGFMNDVNKAIAIWESMSDEEKQSFIDGLSSASEGLSEEQQWYKSIETEATEVHVENKTIIITDPCYISDGECEDWKHDFEPYIVKSTIYGDWSCSVYKGNKEDAERIEREYAAFEERWDKKWENEAVTEEDETRLRDEYNAEDDAFKAKNFYGSFCADAGMVAVYDASKIPAEKLQWCKKSPWCACIIENYTGPIKYVIDENRGAHIVGDGFYSSQTGL